MGINELEKVVREAAVKKDFHSLEKSTLTPEFAKAAKTLSQRKGKKVTSVSLLNPTIAVWW